MSMTLSRVDSWRRSDLPRTHYDCFIAAIGYESRAKHFAELTHPNAKSQVAIGFTNRCVLSYQDNLDWYSKAKFAVEEPNDAAFSSVVENAIRKAVRATDGPEAMICIDISSLTRYRLAEIINVLRRIDCERPVTADFVYSAAKFSRPPESTGPNQDVGPLPGFAGWAEPALPSTVVVGVGYEKDKALGAVRYLDPEEVWAFVPTGHAKSYTREIEKANVQLWDLIPIDKRVLYDVNRPFDCLVTLDSFTRGALRTDKVTLLPFGPKLFALNSLLVALVHNSVAVWRVSTGHRGEPIDRLPNGKIIGLRVSFQPDNSEMRAMDVALASSDVGSKSYLV